MKVLITGGAGLLGTELIRQLSGRFDISITKHATALNSVHTAITIDLTDANTTVGLLRTHEYDAVINAAGAPVVDKCELDYEYAHSGNVVIVKNLLNALQGRRTHFYHVSTDYVFDGSSGPDDEDALPHPINHYGVTKWEAESLVTASGCAATIVRVCALYALDLQARSNLYNSVVNALAQEQSYVAATDLNSNPTNVADLARAIGDLVAASARPKVIHLAGAEHLSRFDFARKVARHAGLSEGLVIPVTTAELKLAARRPLHAGLRSSIARSILGSELPALS